MTSACRCCHMHGRSVVLQRPSSGSAWRVARPAAGRYESRVPRGLFEDPQRQLRGADMCASVRDSPLSDGIVRWEESGASVRGLSGCSVFGVRCSLLCLPRFRNFCASCAARAAVIDESGDRKNCAFQRDLWWQVR